MHSEQGMGYILLITGGARSGKSSYALGRCEALPGERYFLATSPVTDPEMGERIRKHKEERRGRGWTSIEEDLAVAETIRTCDQADVILVDCLTLWVNNLMYSAELQAAEFGEAEMKQRAAQLVLAAKAFHGTTCLVTNEVGSGIVPENRLARKYRDLVGRCNRMIAEKADEVVLVSCGIPLVLKQ